MAAGHYSLHGVAPWRTNCDDAFLLGCRKIGDFLLNRSRSHARGHELEDILAGDYVPKNATQNWELSIWTKQWRDAMNKQLPHISYKRDKEWDHQIWVPGLLKEFNGPWWNFREAVPDKEFKKEFDAQLHDCQTKEGFSNNISLGRL